MEVIKAIPTSPWADIIKEIVQSPEVPKKALLVGPVGADLLECAREIHNSIDPSRPFIEVTCLTNNELFYYRLLGKVSIQEEYEPATSVTCAVLEAANGTLVLDEPECCSQLGLSLLQQLFGEGFKTNEYTMRIDPGTHILGLLTKEWEEDPREPTVVRLFEREFTVKAITENSSIIPNYFAWYLKRTQPRIGDIHFEKNAWDLMCSHPWPGDRRQLKECANSLSGTLTVNPIIRVEDCQDIIKYHGNVPYQDELRKKESARLSSGLFFRGATVKPRHIYEWISQFSQVAPYPGQRPWEIGFCLVRELVGRYFFSHQRLTSLLNTAFDKLIGSLGSQIEDTTIAILEAGMGFKSTNQATRSVFIRAKSEFHVEAVPMSRIHILLEQPQPLVVYVDDFVGTGSQVYEQVIRPIQNTIDIYFDTYKHKPFSLVCRFSG